LQNSPNRQYDEARAHSRSLHSRQPQLGNPAFTLGAEAQGGAVCIFGYFMVYARSNSNRSAPPSVSMARNRSADEVFGVSERNIAMVLT
jgi:hypothetical protein